MVATCLAALLGSTAFLAQSADQSLGAMERAAGAPLATTTSPVTGLPGFIRTPAGRPIPVALPADAPAADRAVSFLQTYAATFGLKGSADLRVGSVDADDEVGMDHVRLQQLHQGIPVTGGEVSVHLRGNGVVAVNARTVADLGGVDTVPIVSATDARSTARQLLDKHHGAGDAELGEPRLEIFNRGHLEGRRSPTRLAWFVEAKKLDLWQYIWIDARHGNVLLSFSQLAHARDRMIHDAGSTSALPGTLVRDEGDPATGDADTDLAYDYSGDVYDYFFTEHGRDSYDDAGATMISTVHFCPDPGDCPFANAFWSGTQMVYGEGFSVADDVVAHELTHAVTNFSANLYYYMQSGALNESFSDIFGETVDLTNGSANDLPAVRWELGEEIGAIRNLEDPTIYGNPGKMSDPEFACLDAGTDPSGDRGGVHLNSGVPNHAYALMVDGGSYNGKTVTGMGLTKAGKIQYRALTQYLLSSSDFLDNYNALQQACTDLIGTAGISAADCTEVKDAVDAVEMSDPWPCSPAQPIEPELCGPGQMPQNLFFDDFESGFDNWAISTASGPSLWFIGDFASSGTANLYGFNADTTADSSAVMLVDVAIPAGTTMMQFHHSHGFENEGGAFYDGGVIECSDNAGASWIDAGPLISAGADYGGMVDGGFLNPLAGRSAFVGETWGYTATQLNISSLAGQNIRFRFRVGTDSSISDEGWSVDDVRVYQCVDAPTTTTTSSTSTTSSVPTTVTSSTSTTLIDDCCGDPTGDGNILATDCLIILQKSVSLPVECPVQCCDIGGEGSVTATDALVCLQCATGGPCNLNCSGSMAVTE